MRDIMIRRNSFGMAVAFCALVRCASSTPPPAPPPVVAAPVEAPKADPVSDADAAEKRGDLAAALAAYERALAADPNDAIAGFKRAKVLASLSRWDEALKAYETYLVSHPKHVEATVNLGAVLRELGKKDEAVSLYKKFLKDQPFESRVLNNLAVLYREKGDFKAAVDTVRTLLLRDPKNVDAYKNLALVHFEQGKTRLAQTILANALKMAEEKGLRDAAIHVNLGLTHAALGDKGRAMLSFKKALEVDPGNLLAHYNIGALALQHRDYDLAARSFEPCTKAWPNDPEVAADLGYAFQGQQKLNEAAAQLEKARALQPKGNLDPIIYQLMVVWQAAEQPNRALEYGNELLKIRNVQCKSDDYDGLCGRINGIKMMIDMKNKPQAKEEDKKPKATGDVDKIFTEAGAEGGEVPPDASQSAPADEGTPKEREKSDTATGDGTGNSGP